MLKLRIFLFAFVISTFTTFMPSHAMELNREKLVVIGCVASVGLAGGLYAYSPAFKAFSQKVFQFFGFGSKVVDCRDGVSCGVPQENFDDLSDQENCREIQTGELLAGSEFDQAAFEKAYNEMVGNDDPIVKAEYEGVCRYLLSGKYQEEVSNQVAFEKAFSTMINGCSGIDLRVYYWKKCKELLVSGICNPNVLCKMPGLRWSPLSYACESNDIEMVRLLLGCQDIDVDGCNLRDAYFTPLTMACSEGNHEIVELLLKAGANPKDIADQLFRSILGLCCCATEDKKHKIVRLLLQYGANPNVMVSRPGETALMWAESFEIMKELIEHGANVNHRRNDGMSVLDCMLKNCRNGVFKNYKDINNRVSLLIKSGCDINSQDAKGRTALHRIMQHSLHHIVQRPLLRISLDRIEVPSIPLEGVQSMIQLFSLAGRHPEVVSILLHYGADPMVKNKQGKTVFDCAENGTIKQMLLDNDPAMRPFKIDTFVKPEIERSVQPKTKQSESKNIAHYLRNREIGGMRRIAGK